MALLNRDDIVDVVGEYDEEHYVIKTDADYGLVENSCCVHPVKPHTKSGPDTQDMAQSFTATIS